MANNLCKTHKTKLLIKKPKTCRVHFGFATQKQTRDRNREGAKKLWQSFTLSLSIVRRLWSVISGKPTHCVIPSKRHQTVGKETGKTNYIERFNCTLRALSFSFGRENFIVFQKDGKSHRSDLVFCPLRQRILTSLGLPNLCDFLPQFTEGFPFSRIGIFCPTPLV